MIVLTLLAAVGFWGGQEHYLLLFAHQDAPYGERPDPHTAHSFATWIEVDEGRIVEAFTISWTGVHGVKFLRGPQPPRSLTLEQSLARAQRRGLPVTMWGPFRVTHTCFTKARCAHQRLIEGERTGSVLYNVLDWKTRSERRPQAINCIHVLTDVARPGLRTGSRCGIRATEFILDAYLQCGFVLGEDPSAEWVWEALGGGFAVRRRTRVVAPFEGQAPSPAASASSDVAP
jgi:hypothetical protein